MLLLSKKCEFYVCTLCSAFQPYQLTMYSLEHQKCFILLLEPVYWLLLWPVFGSSLSCLVGHYIISKWTQRSGAMCLYSSLSCKIWIQAHDTFCVPDCMYLHLIWQRQFWLAKFDKILFLNKIKGFHIHIDKNLVKYQ